MTKDSHQGTVVNAQVLVSLGTDSSELGPEEGWSEESDTRRNQSPFSQRFLKQKKKKKTEKKIKNKKEKEKVVFPPPSQLPLFPSPRSLPQSPTKIALWFAVIYLLSAASCPETPRREGVPLGILGASTFDDRRPRPITVTLHYSQFWRMLLSTFRDSRDLVHQ